MGSCKPDNIVGMAITVYLWPPVASGTSIVITGPYVERGLIKIRRFAYHQNGQAVFMNLLLRDSRHILLRDRHGLAPVG